MAAERVTYVLVDGENIDATLGTTILGRKPAPDERPRWDRVRQFAGTAWGQPVRSLFFLNASSGFLPMSFVQALLSMGYRPIPLSGSAGVKVVDVGIQRTLDAIADREGDVLLVTHDADFVDHVARLLDDGRRVGLVGFPEMTSNAFEPLRARGLVMFDLERDVNAFNAPLPRVRIIPLEEFDPLAYL
jgi:uncharacterized protein